ncbi:hypothetical protein CITRIK5_70405 [Citricoccus sp. K5]|nr:hypothetical protein CITRIK5_70405 [Citricoccus sp. K5]
MKVSTCFTCTLDADKTGLSCIVSRGTYYLSHSTDPQEA